MQCLRYLRDPCTNPLDCLCANCDGKIVFKKTVFARNSAAPAVGGPWTVPAPCPPHCHATVIHRLTRAVLNSIRRRSRRPMCGVLPHQVCVRATPEPARRGRRLPSPAAPAVESSWVARSTGRRWTLPRLDKHGCWRVLLHWVLDPRRRKSRGGGGRLTRGRKTMSSRRRSGGGGSRTWTMWKRRHNSMQRPRSRPDQTTYCSRTRRSSLIAARYRPAMESLKVSTCCMLYRPQ